MSMIRLQNYAANKWISGEGKLAPIFSAVNGQQIAETGSDGIDFKKMARRCAR